MRVGAMEPTTNDRSMGVVQRGAGAPYMEVAVMALHPAPPHLGALASAVAPPLTEEQMVGRRALEALPGY